MVRVAPILLLMLTAGAQRPDVAPVTSRGEAIAMQKCAVCHALGPAGESPNSAAPAFRRLALRYNELNLEHHLGQMAGRPHGDMRQLTLTPDEISEIAAYIADH